ncbi:MAG: M1 family aminopeptidase [Planctomycetota bacterium]|nr:M1 family aminopeptidase [Planctomycetota bacterium]
MAFAPLLLTAFLWGSIEIDAVRLLVDGLHSYDLERMVVEARPGAEGLEVQCDLTLRATRAAAPSFFLSTFVQDLEVTRNGKVVVARLGTGGLEEFLRKLEPKSGIAPTLLTLLPDPLPAAGERMTFRLRYRWKPPGGMHFYADAKGVQTHNFGFWLPAMADELFDASIRVLPPDGMTAVASGYPEADVEGALTFRTKEPVQVLSLVVGSFKVHESRAGGRTLRVLLPPDAQLDPARVSADWAALLKILEGWFGPAPGDPLTLLFEPRDLPSPTYNDGAFICINRRYLQWAGAEGGKDLRARKVWLRLLAHECAHYWWGHRVPSPVLGRGGNWIREGLAEWSGVRAAEELLRRQGTPAPRSLFRRNLRWYLTDIDLRRAARNSHIVLANEVSLRDATYLDPGRVAYARGALVHRQLESLLGADAFVQALRALAKDRAHAFTTTEDYVTALDPDGKLGVAEWVDYYVNRTRLPDLELGDVRVRAGGATAAVLCRDPDWPGGAVPFVVVTEEGRFDGKVVVVDGKGTLEWKGRGEPLRIELDPERLTLDPVRKNNVWEKAGD